jgi:hypothetical protein
MRDKLTAENMNKSFKIRRNHPIIWRTPSCANSNAQNKSAKVFSFDAFLTLYNKGSSLLVMLKTLINSSNRLLGKKDSF